MSVKTLAAWVKGSQSAEKQKFEEEKEEMRKKHVNGTGAPCGAADRTVQVSRPRATDAIGCCVKGNLLFFVVLVETEWRASYSFDVKKKKNRC